eukprot:2992796-Amphidinium_carterae.1
MGWDAAAEQSLGTHGQHSSWLVRSDARPQQATVVVQVGGVRHTILIDPYVDAAVQSGPSKEASTWQAR